MKIILSSLFLGMLLISFHDSFSMDEQTTFHIAHFQRTTRFKVPGNNTRPEVIIEVEDKVTFEQENRQSTTPSCFDDIKALIAYFNCFKNQSEQTEQFEHEL